MLQPAAAAAVQARLQEGPATDRHGSKTSGLASLESHSWGKSPLPVSLRHWLGQGRGLAAMFSVMGQAGTLQMLVLWAGRVGVFN